jgi:ribonuclease HII
LAVVAGIDEAGYGPVLGPLLVSVAAFELPEACLDADLWKLLAGTVTRKPNRRAGTLAIGDSKKLFHRKRPNALEHLERGVLAVLATRGVRVSSLRQLLGVLSPGAADRLGDYPWYARADMALPHCISATDAALAGNALSAAMAAAGVRLTAMRSEAILVGEYNRVVRATHNKSNTLFDVNSRLFAYLWGKLWQAGSPGTVRLCVDRHGGRIHYRRALQRVFNGCDFRILGESRTCSGYWISDRRRAMELRFGVEFDRLHLPVALASMVSKYLRELFMELLNRYWAAQVADLAPTAGYYADGKRFLADIDPAVGDLALDRDLLERCR